MTIERASDNPFPSILMEGAADPEALASDPAAGQYRFVIDDTGAAWIVDSTGTATAVGGGGGGGAVATDAIWDAAGDLVQGTGADTAAKLSAGTAGMFLKSAGAAAANLWAFPPGYELDYAERTSNTSITATSEATANTIVTGSSVAYDGSTIVKVEFWCDHMKGASGQDLRIWLYDGSSSIGFITYTESQSYVGGYGVRRITPSNASHTYSVRASVGGASTGVVAAGAGGSGAVAPAFLRITKV